MKKIIVIILLFIVTCCQNKSEKKFDKLEKMNWLVGDWEQKLPDGTIRETWTRQNDSTFSGTSFFINAKDTVHFETIKLHQNIGKFVYSATIVGQNNEEPIDFKLTSDAENTFIFENPSHDYPQKITYKKLGNNNVIITISGKQQGKISQESYSIKKK